MQIETLKMFCDLVDTGSFTRCAVINEVTQSAVSQQMSALERIFKTPLLDRGQGKGKPVTPTPKGKKLYDHSQKLLAAYGILMQQMDCAPADGGRSRGVTETAQKNSGRDVVEEIDPNDPKI